MGSKVNHLPYGSFSFTANILNGFSRMIDNLFTQHEVTNTLLAFAESTLMPEHEFPGVEGVPAHYQNDTLKNYGNMKLLMPLLSIVYPSGVMFNGAKNARATFDISYMV